MGWFSFYKYSALERGFGHGNQPHPKSIIQTSPVLAAGILILQAIKHQSAFESRLIAKLDVFVLRSQLQQLFAHGAPLGFREFRQLIYDLDRAHEFQFTRAKLFCQAENLFLTIFGFDIGCRMREGGRMRRQLRLEYRGAV